MADLGGYTFKIVLLGEGCVGKTSCVLRYVEDKYNDKHITTLQVTDFFKKNVLCLMQPFGFFEIFDGFYALYGLYVISFRAEFDKP